VSGVDNRVVSMTFDNASFERKIAETIKSLESLHKSLNFSGSKAGLQEIADATGRFNLGHVTTQLESINAGFLAMATVGITALANIATAAIRTGAQLSKSLTVEPVMDGLREYETNLNSIQTILANTQSKGTTLDQVNAALQKLNEYSDKTIYNFGEMAKNIGTFTAAGVDLDTSVSAIKGIANLAALSGSNSNQAATAMYQLSQAIAAGSVKLMDWNSIVNAGMGGEVFKNALFETAKVMGTLTDVPVNQSFKQWEDAGNSFRESLEKGWITADVLTTTLSTFTGDMTKEMLLAKGFNEQQAESILKVAKTAQAAATEVKTFSQLVGTVREAVGTGWADTFKILIGNFDEAKSLWTGVNNAIGAFVSNSANARNQLLQGWKDFGGRTLLIEALKDAFSALGKVINSIKLAFRSVFPKTTTADLLILTKGFADFTERLKSLTEKYMPTITRLFQGLFSAISIGWEIIKGVVGVFGDLAGALFGLGSSPALSFFERLAKSLTTLRESLVNGNGISDFFDRIGSGIRVAAELVRGFASSVKDIFSGIDLASGEVLAVILDRIRNRLEMLGKFSSGAIDLFGWISDKFSTVIDTLEPIFDGIRDWFADLGRRLAEVIKPSDFDASVDAVNVGFIGGILLTLRKFTKEGLKLDFGDGFLNSVTDALDQLTSTLKTMQTAVKADALIKIAGAIGILTGSVLVLSLIDSGTLTKSLTAMAVGFGQLLTSFAVLSNLNSGLTGAASFTILSTGLIALSSAILILTGAVRSLSSLSPKELMTGLAGIAALLTEITIAAGPLSRSAPGMIVAGIGIVAVSAGLVILSQAVKLFGGLSWGEIGKGLVGIAGGIAVITAAVNLMPPSMPAMGIGIIAISAGLLILAQAVQSFAALSWSELGKGLAGIAGGLIAIALAMNLMPPSLALTGVGLLIVSAAINVMAVALKSLAEMSLTEMAKGIGALAATLLILGVATTAMTGSIGGAVAIAIASASLALLADVLKTFAKMKIGDIAKGLLAIVAAMAVIGVTALALAPAAAALAAFGLALIAVGAGFALFGVGAYLVAKAFEALAKAGENGAKGLVTALKTIIVAIPDILKGVAEGIVELIKVLIEAAPTLIKGLVVILEKLLEGVITLAPKIAEALVAIFREGLKAIRDIFPEIVKTGIDVLTALLSGIRDNIAEFVTLGMDIIENFLKGIADNIEDVITSAVDIIVNFVKGIGDNLYRVINAGGDLIVKFLKGITDNVSKVAGAVTTLITTFITEVGNAAGKISKAGADMIIKFIKGISDSYSRVITAGVDVVLKFIEGLSKNAQRLADGAFKVITDFLNGLARTIDKRAPELRKAGINLADSIIDGITGGLGDGAKKVFQKAIGIAGGAVNAVKSALGINSPSKVFMKIGAGITEGFAMGIEKDQRSPQLAAESFARSVTNAFNQTLGKLPKNLSGLDDISPVITPVLDMSKVEKDAKTLSTYFDLNPVAASLSFTKAQNISKSTKAQADTVQEPYSGPQVVENTFVQNNHSPKALSTGDIYRQTRSQLAMAKEELGISS